jgi:hypothetical protein
MRDDIRRRAILTEVLHGFPQVLQEVVGPYLKSCHDPLTMQLHGARILLEKLIVAQLRRTLSAVHGTEWFITVFTRS